MRQISRQAGRMRTVLGTSSTAVSVSLHWTKTQQSSALSCGGCSGHAPGEAREEATTVSQAHFGRCLPWRTSSDRGPNEPRCLEAIPAGFYNRTGEIARPYNACICARRVVKQNGTMPTTALLRSTTTSCQIKHVGIHQRHNRCARVFPFTSKTH